MLEAGSLIGKYVVRRKIAEGGMAEIYLAEQRGLEGFRKEVAIKRVRPYLAQDPTFIQMFVSEARLASRLNHANVVQIFDFDRHEDTYYIAMEYVRGTSLFEARKRCKERWVAMPLPLIADVGAAIARGLHHAHTLSDGGRALGIVHRDISPHNVLLSFDGQVKLTDFGIAKAAGKTTVPGILKGKFAYMSPEQAGGERVDARSDIFSLGIVLWELVTGARLFQAQTDVALLRAVRESVIPPPSRLQPQCPSELEAIILRALDRRIDARYPSAQELERALGGFVLRSVRSVDETNLAALLQPLFAAEMAALEAQDRGDASILRPAPAQVDPTAVTPLAERPGPPPAPEKPVEREASRPDVTITTPTHSLPDAEGEPGRSDVAGPSPRLARSAVAASGDSDPAGVRVPGPGTTPQWAAPDSRLAQALVAPSAPTLPAATLPDATPAQPLPVGPAMALPASPAAAAESRRSHLAPAVSAELEAAALGGPRRHLAAMGLVFLVTAGLSAFLLSRWPSSAAPAADGPPSLAAPTAPPDLAPAPVPAAQAATDNTPAPSSPRAISAPSASPGGTPVTAADSGADTEATGDARPEGTVARAPTRDAGTNRPARRREGTLLVHVRPWAHVDLAGRMYEDVSGNRPFRLPPGSYRVRFFHNGKMKRDVTVTIETGKTTEETFDAMAN